VLLVVRVVQVRELVVVDPETFTFPELVNEAQSTFWRLDVPDTLKSPEVVNEVQPTLWRLDDPDTVRLSPTATLPVTVWSPSTFKILTSAVISLLIEAIFGILCIHGNILPPQKHEDKERSTEREAQ
jgi:hypothetical protein